VVRALLDYLHGEVRIAYAVHEKWGDELGVLLKERQQLRAHVVPVVRDAQARARATGGQSFRDCSGSAEVLSPAEASVLSGAISSSPAEGVPSIPAEGLGWVPGSSAAVAATLRRLTRSVVYARLARAATGAVRTMSGERAGVGKAARTQFLERLWCASLASAGRIPLDRIEAKAGFLHPIAWAPWLPPYWMSGRLLAAMDAEVSGAGLGDPHRVKELLLSAVETTVWEAGERMRSWRSAEGKDTKALDVGAEDLLPLLVLAVSRCSNGEQTGDAGDEPAASTMAPAAQRCPWRLPLQTLNYLANFAIGRDSAAGRLSYLVITLHGALTFVMQRAKETGAEASMQTMARARRMRGARGERAMHGVGSGRSPFTDSDSDDAALSTQASPRPLQPKVAAAAADSVSASGPDEMAEDDLAALEDMEAAAAAEALALPASAAKPAMADVGDAEPEPGQGRGGHDAAGDGSPAASPAKGWSAVRKQVRVDMAIQRLASQGSEAAPHAWTPGVDAGAELHRDEALDSEAGSEAPDDADAEGPGLDDELRGMSEQEATMIAMPGDADRPDQAGMRSLKQWLGQQELLEDTVEILT